MGWFNHQPDMLQFLWCPFKGILIFFSPKPAPFMCLRASSKTQQNPKVSDTIDIYNLQSLSDLDAPLSFEPAGLFIYMYAYNICIYYIYIYIYICIYMYLSTLAYLRPSFCWVAKNRLNKGCQFTIPPGFNWHPLKYANSNRRIPR